MYTKRLELLIRPAGLMQTFWRHSFVDITHFLGVCKCPMRVVSTRLCLFCGLHHQFVFRHFIASSPHLRLFDSLHIFSFIAEWFLSKLSKLRLFFYISPITPFGVIRDSHCVYQSAPCKAQCIFSSEIWAFVSCEIKYFSFKCFCCVLQTFLIDEVLASGQTKIICRIKITRVR